MDKALKGLKVIEMGHVVAGPFCAAMMGDFGADVIKVETPGLGDGLRSMGRIPNMSFAVEGRNKRCITLNLRTEKGKDLLKKLLLDADILIENYRPGVLEKLGFGWEAVHSINKRLILISISGFGQTGPYKDKPGYDSTGMAMGGLTNVSGFPDGPPVRPGFVIGDYITGLFAVIGAMFAIYARDVQMLNYGQMVDASLYESVYRVTESMTTEYSYDGHVRNRIGNGNAATVPSGHFQTKDDKWMVTSAGNDKVFANFAKCVGREDLIDNPEFKTQVDRSRPDNRAYVQKIAIDFISSHTLKENLEIFDGKVPAAAIYSIEDIFNDPQYAARGNIVEVDHEIFGKIKMQNVVPRLTATPGEVKWPGQSIGKHNDEIFESVLKLSKEEIAQLRAEKVI